MELSYIINNQIGTGLTNAVRIGSLAASSISNNIVDTDTSTVLDYLEFATDSLDKVRIFIKGKGAENNYANGISLDGSSVLTSARPNNLINCGQWDVISYNTSTNQYKFKWNLKGQIFPKGCTIYIENQDTANAHNAGVWAAYRTL